MALFVWRCKGCKALSRRILPSRPKLGPCTACQGELYFATSVASQTMEVIDNGLMAKVLERPVNIEEKMSERNAQADTEQSDEQIV